MPTYEYECTGCAHRFELRRSFSDTGTVSCPRCGSRAARIFTSVPIIFKGSGFYVTDHRGKDFSSPADNGSEVKTSSLDDK
ncbi:MAG: zinc ribbon domain-containing protein [Chloroflexi bacterium]|nr:zinc ribbon domain-containing protein [Chloroflexota bacterium]